MQYKWGEYSIVIKRFEEPSLVHLEEWLSARVLARKEARVDEGKGRDDQRKFAGSITGKKEDVKQENSTEEPFNGAVTSNLKLEYVARNTHSGNVKATQI